MTKEELEKLKDFKLYVFEGEVYVKAEDYKKIAIENKKLKEERDLYKARNEELNENCFGLSKENENLKEELKQLEERYDRNAELYKRLLEENRRLKEELEELKSTYVYDAKQVRDIC